jgi:hypothetical protein
LKAGPNRDLLPVPPISYTLAYPHELSKVVQTLRVLLLYYLEISVNSRDFIHDNRKQKTSKMGIYTLVFQSIERFP